MLSVLLARSKLVNKGRLEQGSPRGRRETDRTGQLNKSKGREGSETGRKLCLGLSVQGRGGARAADGLDGLFLVPRERKEGGRGKGPPGPRG